MTVEGWEMGGGYGPVDGDTSRTDWKGLSFLDPKTLYEGSYFDCVE